MLHHNTTPEFNPAAIALTTANQPKEAYAFRTMPVNLTPDEIRAMVRDILG